MVQGHSIAVPVVDLHRALVAVAQPVEWVEYPCWVMVMKVTRGNKKGVNESTYSICCGFDNNFMGCCCFRSFVTGFVTTSSVSPPNIRMCEDR